MKWEHAQGVNWRRYYRGLNISLLLLPFSHKLFKSLTTRQFLTSLIQRDKTNKLFQWEENTIHDNYAFLLSLDMATDMDMKSSGEPLACHFPCAYETYFSSPPHL